MPIGIYDRSKSKPRRKTGGRPAGSGILPEDEIVCLTCTKKVCYGGGDCFNARKKERRKKETTK